jgi:hypothetical protein
MNHHVRRFLIYREGSAVNWQCDFVDLEKATGIPKSTIRSICSSPDWKRRGWYPKRASERIKEISPETEVIAVDRLMLH